LVWLDAALANDIFNAASPVSSGTVAVTVVDGLYQEDVATVPVVEPAVQPDVPKPEEAATQALSIPTLHPRRKIMPLMHVHSSCGSLGQQAVRDIGFAWFCQGFNSK